MSTPRALERSGLRPGQAGGAASSLAALLGLLLVPKCPLCVAAYLASLGLSAGLAAAAAPLIRPFAWALCAAALAAVAWAWLKRPSGTPANEAGGVGQRAPHWLNQNSKVITCYCEEERTM